MAAPETAPVREVFVARQAIFDDTLRVTGYELLFRRDGNDAFPADLVDPTRASLEVVLHGLTTIGMEVLTNGKPAFVNVTRDLLLGDLLTALPAEKFVLEVPEDLVADADVRAALRDLKSAGYRIALDDVVEHDERLALLDLADIAKIDVRDTTPAARQRLISQAADAGAAPLAEKVETTEEVRSAFAAGCAYAQGFFLARPSLHTGRHGRGLAAAQLAALRAVRQSEMDFATVEAAVRQDVVLAQHLLKYLNAAAFGWRQEIRSIRHALTLLGEEMTRRWVTMAVLGLAAAGKPHELITMACIRAHLCQTLGSDAGLPHHDFDLFTLGMFSLLDAILDQPRAQALEGLPITDEVRAALLGDQSSAAQLLDLVIACESAEWTRLTTAAVALRLDETRIRQRYLEAVRVAASFTDAAPSRPAAAPA